MAKKIEELNHFAQEMVKVFKEHSTTVNVRSDFPSDQGVTQHLVSNIGLEHLADIFDKVDIRDRAAVYSIFVDTLEQQEIIYDVQQFGGTVH